MGQGYVRADTSNNIADTNVINASDIDGELDAVQAAFAASTGHTHDGTSAEGGPVSVLGPAQDWVATSSALYPKTDNAYDIGQVGNELRDLRVDRFAYIDGLVCEETATFNGATIADLGTVTTADINGGTIDGVVIGGASAANGTFATLVASFGRVTGGDSASLDLQATSVANTHERLRLTKTLTGWALQTANNDASSTVNDLVAVVGASGVSNWQFNTNGSAGFALDSSTGLTFSAAATFSGNLTFTNAAQARTALGITADISDINGGFVPAGGIILWSGSVASIPSGWALCDGTSGTPDLTDRFIVGAGGAYAVDATGGADSVVLSASQIPLHDHSFSGTTSSAGDHTHSASSSTASLTGAADIRRKDGTTSLLSGPGGIISVSEFGGTSLQRVGDGGGSSSSDRLNFDASHAHTISVVSGGTHSHTFSGTTGTSGGGASHENRPPYYALAYIMKL